jgi:hypothetical protein
VAAQPSVFCPKEDSQQYPLSTDENLLELGHIKHQPFHKHCLKEQGFMRWFLMGQYQRTE